MGILFTLVFIAAIIGLIRPFAGLKRKHFGIAAVASFVLVGLVGPGDLENDEVAIAEGEVADATAPALDAVDEAVSAAEDAMADAEASLEEPAPEAIPVRSNWSYHEQRDELRDSTTYFARIQSENSHRFDFPYRGGKLTMTVRKSPAYGTDVYWTIPSGQMVCDFRNCRGSISIDGNVERLTLNEASDGSSDIMFATYGDAILRKLRSAERVVVELEFYQEGSRQFVFETAGLQWDH